MSEIRKPTRIGVRRGATVPRGRFENERIELWAEADLAAGITLQEGLRDLAGSLDELLVDGRRRIQTAVSAPPQPGAQLTLEALEALPWKQYREGHRAGWIFAEKAPRHLLSLLEREGKSVAIGEFRYRFSGAEESPRLFVSRAPVNQ